MKRYLEGRLQHAREHGGEGLIAELVRVEMEGGPINANEMISMAPAIGRRVGSAENARCTILEPR
jgi:hypothetical protein